MPKLATRCESRVRSSPRKWFSTADSSRGRGWAARACLGADKQGVQPLFCVRRIWRRNLVPSLLQRAASLPTSWAGLQTPRAVGWSGGRWARVTWLLLSVTAHSAIDSAGFYLLRSEREDTGSPSGPVILLFPSNKFPFSCLTAWLSFFFSALASQRGRESSQVLFQH